MKYKKFDRPVQKENETYERFRERLINWTLKERERALYRYLEVLDLHYDKLSKGSENEL